jgi:aerobic-type carbon monoxide dehydrogenase small subunit (CoxS/CutS family)
VTAPRTFESTGALDDSDMMALGLPEPHVVIRTEVNGIACTEQVPARLHAADFLRHQLGLTGTHVGCEQGVCGMCTVVVDGQAVKSCLMLAAQLDGSRVQTVESLGDGQELTPLQMCFKRAHGLQCGFCTPGFLMTTTALAAQERTLSRDQLRNELAGVMCRCTGYAFIVDAVAEYLETEGKLASDD